MGDQDFTAAFSVDQTPDEVFSAINNVRGWWSENIEGRTEKPDDEFTYRYKNVHICTMKLTDVVPGKKVVWRVLDNYFDFLKDQSEWKGTEVRFEISRKGTRTELLFTHAGLVPSYDCYDICSEAWSFYIKESLRNLVTTGKGEPIPKE